MINVLVVDDSSFMRVNIKTLLESDNDIKVTGIARTGKDAINKVLAIKPDVVTMDINLPDISGIDVVELILKQYPVPIIMVSSLTFEGANETIEALSKGAVDYVNKAYLTKETLIAKVRLAAEAAVSLSDVQADHIPAPTIYHSAFQIIGIGISTGGPKALSKFIPEISPNISAGIVVAQHMPPSFTKSLAERLDSESKLKVKEAEEGDIVKPGCVYIIPGGMHGKLQAGGTISLYPKEAYPQQLYIPSADILMSSIAQTYQDNALCIIMTGMGSDGLEGIKEAKRLGSYIMAQSESSSTIFGMPKSIIANHLQHEIIHLDDIGQRINKLCKPIS